MGWQVVSAVALRIVKFPLLEGNIRNMVVQVQHATASYKVQ